MNMKKEAFFIWLKKDIKPDPDIKRILELQNKEEK